jgi:hypothetical protein
MLIIIVGMGAILAGDDEDENEARSPASTKTTATNQARSPAATMTASINRNVDREIEIDLRRTMRGNSWYDNVERISVSGDRVEVFTNLYVDAEGRQFALAICRAVSLIIYIDRTELGLTELRILGQGDRLLISKSSKLDDC